MVRHGFDRYFLFSKPPKNRTVKGLSAVGTDKRQKCHLCSQTRRDTNFAIPGYSLLCHDTTASGKNKVFSVCGHLCGQRRFCAAFCNRGKSRKCRRRKALRRFTLSRPGYRHGTPKPPALPAAPHPDLLSFL